MNPLPGVSIDSTPLVPPVPTDHEPLGALVAIYRTHIDALRTASAIGMPEVIVETLRGRDEIERSLSAGDEGLPHEILELSHADQALRAMAGELERKVGVRALNALKLATAHPDQGWWWNIEEYLPHPKLRWTALAAILFTAAISLLTEIARRFFAEGPDLVGALYILVQAGLALFAGSTLISSSGSVVGRLLDKRNVRRAQHPKAKAVLAFAMLALVIGAYLLLPAIARQYSATGVSRAQAGLKNRAIQDFRRALSLSPDFAIAHYNLGRAYEDVLEYDNALPEYQKAIQLQGGFYEAYNNLARLYIVQKNDPASALTLINEALDHSEGADKPDDGGQVRLALLKNRGWANLKAGNFAIAYDDLSEALAIEPTRASVHCLLAQVQEKRSLPSSAEWNLCLVYSNGAKDMEQEWLAMAQDRDAAARANAGKVMK